jgi:flavin reductase (DIM6/NTAB) family NADH-FMN oxidoreductase RutF/rubredoxin
MIDYAALSHVSYGLYVVCSGNKEAGNGYISNTFFQVTSEPVQFATCCNKDNYTAELIRKTGIFSASVLHEKTEPEVFGTFGYRSGKNFDKLSALKVDYSESGTPVFKENIIAWLECRVVQTFDVGSHWIFIGELVNSEIVDDSIDPITYLYYKRVNKGVAPKNAPTYIDPTKTQESSPTRASKYKCAACGYIYDDATEEIKFEDLPDDWTCPLCGSEKEDFYKL